eukprot:56777_1
MQPKRATTNAQSDDHYLIAQTSEELQIQEAPSSKRYDKKIISIVLLSCLLLCAVVIIILLTFGTFDSIGKSPSPSIDSIPMPSGVNLGSWLSLEDYFYVGPTGAVEVATPNDQVVGNCLPPLHTNPSTGPKWNSETDLYSNLTSMEGGSIRNTIKIFEAFRTSYLDWDQELAKIASLGIKHVRVPISWCLTDHDPSKDDILARDDGAPLNKEDDDELEQRFTCLDPFFDKHAIEVRWPAVPRPFLASFLRACSKYNLKAILDIHTYPGGTSLGTFSGIWPRKPLFWKYDDPENPKDDIGRNLLRDLFAWIESMQQSYPDAFNSIKIGRENVC